MPWEVVAARALTCGTLCCRDKARPNSELKVAPLTNPSAAKVRTQREADQERNWHHPEAIIQPKFACFLQVLLAHREDVELEFVEVSQGFLAAFERRNGLQQAVVYR